MKKMWMYKNWKSSPTNEKKTKTSKMNSKIRTEKKENLKKKISA